ncbi:hypothetical protein NP233_g8800 [Leucocoprinus birnbaumii]|uniref:Uncharacterized protein n=1 Tax=Leucocoprinus birnbaumii TaxID=56174 RepID=A0AAD5YTD8_9AGAR|nr:hypothetical protein NP233_g8800 [Leucocoprinus birnbaumii]
MRWITLDSIMRQGYILCIASLNYSQYLTDSVFNTKAGEVYGDDTARKQVVEESVILLKSVEEFRVSLQPLHDQDFSSSITDNAEVADCLSPDSFWKEIQESLPLQKLTWLMKMIRTIESNFTPELYSAKLNLQHITRDELRWICQDRLLRICLCTMKLQSQYLETSQSAIPLKHSLLRDLSPGASQVSSNAKMAISQLLNYLNNPPWLLLAFELRDPILRRHIIYDLSLIQSSSLPMVPGAPEELHLLAPTYLHILSQITVAASKILAIEKRLYDLRSTGYPHLLVLKDPASILAPVFEAMSGVQGAVRKARDAVQSLHGLLEDLEKGLEYQNPQEDPLNSEGEIPCMKCIMGDLSRHTKFLLAESLNDHHLTGITRRDDEEAEKSDYAKLVEDLTFEFIGSSRDRTRIEEIKYFLNGDLRPLTELYASSPASLQAIFSSEKSEPIWSFLLARSRVIESQVEPAYADPDQDKRRLAACKERRLQIIQAARGSERRSWVSRVIRRLSWKGRLGDIRDDPDSK